MKTDLDYLPRTKQRDLDAIVRVIREEYEEAVKLSTQTKKRMRGVLKIILFGSYARDTWVKERWAPHQSDYDILVIVSHQALLKDWDILYRIEDRLYNEEKPDAGIIIHTLQEVNDHIRRGQFFFADIRREGVALWEAKSSRALPQPGNLDAETALDVAKEHYGIWMYNGEGFLTDYGNALKRGDLKRAAFYLHQSTESFYACALLVLINYSPNTHNIKWLRSMVEDRAPGFIPVFPRDQRADKRCFELLKDAYVKARYSKHYKISEEQLIWLGERVAELRDVTDAVSRGRIETLEEMRNLSP